MATVTYTMREARRLAAFQLFNQGIGATEISRRLDYPISSVERWVRRFRQEGEEAIRERPRSGRPNYLSATQRDELVQLLLAGAVAAGFDTDLWTLPRIREVILQQFGVAYHVDYLGRLMARLGFSSQKPQRQSRGRNGQAVADFRETTWARAVKKGG